MVPRRKPASQLPADPRRKLVVLTCRLLLLVGNRRPNCLRFLVRNWLSQLVACGSSLETGVPTCRLWLLVGNWLPNLSPAAPRRKPAS